MIDLNRISLKYLILWTQLSINLTLVSPSEVLGVGLVRLLLEGIETYSCSADTETLAHLYMTLLLAINLQHWARNQSNTSRRQHEVDALLLFNSVVLKQWSEIPFWVACN